MLCECVSSAMSSFSDEQHHEWNDMTNMTNTDTLAGKTNNILESFSAICVERSATIRLGEDKL